MDPKTTTCLTPPRPVIWCTSSDGTEKNQTCKDQGPLTLDRRVLARRRDALHGRRRIDVGEAHLLHRVQVIQVTPVFLEAVCRRQRRRLVAQMVLAEFSGGVAEIVQELGERRGAGLQEGGAAGQLRRDHAGAQRIHAGEEGVAPGGAALHGEVVHEDGALVPMRSMLGVSPTIKPRW